MLLRPIRRLLGRPLAVSYFHTSPSYWASKKVLQKFKLADIGEGITECEVISWSVKPQATVKSFEPLCEVQSDKASVEITSPFDGVVQEILVQEGEIAKVGSALCTIEVDEEVLASDEPAMPEPAAPPPQTASALQPTEAAKLVISKPEPRRLHPMDPDYTPEKRASDVDVLATPSVRHFARQKGVDLVQLAPGSGKRGRIEKSDIEVFLSGASQRATPAPATGSGDVVVELGRTRYGMWKAMVKSLEIPHFGYSTTLDLTALHNILPTLNSYIPPHFLPPPSSPPPPQSISPSSIYPAPVQPQAPSSGQYTRLTYLPILLKTLSNAMAEWPIFRSSITPYTPEGSKPTLTIRPHADISVALSTPTGLYTPTLQRADTHSIYSLASQLKHLSSLGRQIPCGLTPAEMPKRGGTLTVSNVGAIGAGDFASPVLVPGGGVAIVAIGRAKWVWDVDRGDGKGERRLKVGISWSADHRVVEGAELAAFVECWRSYVESPERMIAGSV
ncbi:hypothetical protein EYR36_011952 [Pleurotus pulmonarius]|nr:hypothetical protein EYR36_011952 [Pleurotus pulmonarius]